MRDFITIARALSDENRVRILLALQDHELCVCQLIRLVELAPSTVSKHISVLRQAGLVDVRKEGRWVYCSITRDRTSPEVSMALKWMVSTAGSSRRASADRELLEEILKCDLEELCRQIRGE